MQKGLTTRMHVHVRANEHGSAGGRTPPVVLFGAAGAVGEEGKEVSDLEAIHSRLAGLCAGKIVSASLCPQQGYLVGADGSFTLFTPNELPEADTNRHAKVLLVDESGGMTLNVTIPFIAPGTTEQQVATALLDALPGTGAKLRVNPLAPTVPVHRVARIQFVSRL